MSLFEDAVILAEVVVDQDTWWYGDFGDYGDQDYHCSYCNGSSRDIVINDPRSIKHDIDCPILVALDVLTRK